MKLTARSVLAAQPLILPTGEKKQKVYWDTELRGFGLVASATGKTFIVQKDVAGKSVRCTVGRFGTFTVDEARSDARDLLVRMSKGENPNETKRQEKVLGLTLQEALELKISAMKVLKASKRTMDSYTYNLNTYLADWLDRPLLSITRAETEKKHKQIAVDIAKGKYATVTTKKGTRYTKQRNPDSGQSTANAVMRAFSACWNRTAELYEHLPLCPTIAVTLFPTSPKKYAITSNNISSWYQSVLMLPNPIRRDYLIFALFTGLRRTSAAQTRWEQIDWSDRSLHIPNPKGGERKGFYLPLSDFLINLLEARRAEHLTIFGEANPWIFPAESESGHIEDPRSALLNPDNPEELLDIKWKPHGLRRTFTTVAEGLNLSPYTLKLLLNHQLPKTDVTAGYIEHELNRLHAAMQSITDQLLLLCEAKKRQTTASHCEQT